MSAEPKAPAERVDPALSSPLSHLSVRALAAAVVPTSTGRALLYTIGLPDTWDPDALDARGRRRGTWIRRPRTSGVWCGPGTIPAAWDPYRRRWVAAERAASDREDAADLLVGLVLALDLIEDERRELAERDVQWRAEHGRKGREASPRERAEKYLSRLDPSVAGQGGASALMRAAGALVVGFALDTEVALDMLAAWDAAHSAPPWGRRECARAIKSALRRGGDLGHLLRRERGRRAA